MKKIALSIAGCAAFFAAIAIRAQSPTPEPTASPSPSPSVAPIVVPTPTTKTVTNAITLLVPAAQVPGLAAALASQGVALPAGWKRIIIQAPLASGTNAGALPVQIQFQ